MALLWYHPNFSNKVHVLDDGLHLTLDEIVAQSFIFYVAGYETTATTMTFAFYEVSVHPDVQEKMRNELFKVMKKHDNMVSYDMLNELGYMQQVIEGSPCSFKFLFHVKILRDTKIPILFQKLVVNMPLYHSLQDNAPETINSSIITYVWRKEQTF